MRSKTSSSKRAYLRATGTGAGPSSTRLHAHHAMEEQMGSWYMATPVVQFYSMGRSPPQMAESMGIFRQAHNLLCSVATAGISTGCQKAKKDAPQRRKIRKHPQLETTHDHQDMPRAVRPQSPALLTGYPVCIGLLIPAAMRFLSARNSFPTSMSRSFSSSMRFLSVLHLPRRFSQSFFQSQIAPRMQPCHEPQCYPAHKQAGKAIPSHLRISSRSKTISSFSFPAA